MQANGTHGFRSGPGSFSDLIRRWAGGAPMTPIPSQRPEARSSEPPRVTPEVPIDVASTPPPPAPAKVPAADPATGPVRVRYYGRTDVGLVREHNEDNFLVADLDANLRGTEAPREVTVGEQGCIFAVCDGMGGAAAGEVASQMAVDTIYEVFSKGGLSRDRDAFARRLVTAIEEAGRRIFSAAKMDRTRRGMGTTTTLAGLVDNILFVGQVGDSRAYVLRSGSLEQVTKDQSLVNQLIEAGQLTEEEAEGFEHSNIILQALGTTEEVTVDLTFLELRKGDRLLMCSDGLSGLVHADMIRDVLQNTPDLAEAATKLIQMANAGGGHDNISVIVAEFDGEGLSGPEGVRALYQQYPLPPDEGGRVPGTAPRETSIKSAGAKPGADVKRDEPIAVHARPAERGGKGWLIIVVVVVLLALLAGGYFVWANVLGGAITQPDSTPPVPQVDPTPPDPVQADPSLDVVVDPTQPTVEPGQDVAPAVETGTIRITTDVEDGTLFVNDESRGALTDGMVIDLPPGAYNVEARSGDARVVQQTVTVTAGQEAAVTLSVPAIPDEPAQPPAQADESETRTPRPPRPPRPPRGGTGPNGVPLNPF